MTHRVDFARSAQNYLRRLDRRTQERIAARIDQIARNPFGPYTKSLSGPEQRHSSRVGSYRIIFTVDDATATVEISRIGPRGQVYRGL